MQVNSKVQEAAQPPPAVSAKRDTVDYDTFLQLLVAQLRNQDPMKPVDSTQYVSQLATLSELEQSLKQTDAIERLNAPLNAVQAGSLLGKHVTSADGAVSGVVTSARTSTDGTTLSLDNGKEMRIHAGMEISNQ